MAFGYDSRTSLALLLKSTVSFYCRTFNHPSNDSRIAQLLAGSIRVKHVLNEFYDECAITPIIVSGGCAEISSGFYYKNSHGLSDPKSDLLTHYLNHHRRFACGSHRNYRMLKDRAIIEFDRLAAEEEDGYLALDQFYLNRVRSWYGSSLAVPNNSTFPIFINTVYFELRRRYKAEQRIKHAVNLDIIKSCDQRLLSVPFLTPKTTGIGRIYQFLPPLGKSMLHKVNCARKWRERDAQRVVLPESVLHRLFSESEITRLFCYSKSTSTMVNHILSFENRARKFESQLGMMCSRVA